MYPADSTYEGSPTVTVPPALLGFGCRLLPWRLPLSVPAAYACHAANPSVTARSWPGSSAPNTANPITLDLPIPPKPILPDARAGDSESQIHNQCNGSRHASVGRRAIIYRANLAFNKRAHSHAASCCAPEEKSFRARRKPRSGAPLCPACDAA